MNILELIESYGIKIQKYGSYYKTLCPFHQEKTPSFIIYPQTNSFYCFGCSNGGGMVHFVAQYLNIPYKAAEEIIGINTSSDVVLLNKLKDIKEQTTSFKTQQIEVTVLMNALYKRGTINKEQLLGLCKYIDTNVSPETLSRMQVGLKSLAYK